MPVVTDSQLQNRIVRSGRRSARPFLPLCLLLAVSCDKPPREEPITAKTPPPPMEIGRIPSEIWRNELEPSVAIKVLSAKANKAVGESEGSLDCVIELACRNLEGRSVGVSLLCGPSGGTGTVATSELVSIQQRVELRQLDLAVPYHNLNLKPGLNRVDGTIVALPGGLSSNSPLASTELPGAEIQVPEAIPQVEPPLRPEAEPSDDSSSAAVPLPQSPPLVQATPSPSPVEAAESGDPSSTSTLPSPQPSYSHSPSPSQTRDPNDAAATSERIDSPLPLEADGSRVRTVTSVEELRRGLAEIYGRGVESKSSPQREPRIPGSNLTPPPVFDSSIGGRLDHGAAALERIQVDHHAKDTHGRPGLLIHASIRLRGMVGRQLELTAFLNDRPHASQPIRATHPDQRVGATIFIPLDYVRLEVGPNSLHPALTLWAADRPTRDILQSIRLAEITVQIPVATGYSRPPTRGWR